MVEVVVRPHPDSRCLSIDHQKQTVTIEHKAGKTYSVSSVLTPQTTQIELFEQVLQPLLHRWTSKGEHGSIFAYGFTGTGKSYSLFGTDEQPGAIVLAAHSILESLSLGTQLRVSCYEVGGKHCRDLLAARNNTNNTNTNIDADLTVRVDEHGTAQLRQLDGSGPLTRVVLTSIAGFQAVCSQMQASRRVGKSTVHDASSRTHAIVDLEIVDHEVVRLEQAVEATNADYIDISNRKDDNLILKIREAYKKDGPTAMVNGMTIEAAMQDHGIPNDTALKALCEARRALANYICGSSNKVLAGSFSLIDMAGNDWEQAMIVQTKQASLEHSDINTSLLAVKECFRAMQQKKRHIPYRRANLTKILKRHFEQSSNCVMLATIYPTDEELQLKQTMNTLLYASSITTTKVR